MCAKKYVALALVLLQCATPFLHAHSGNDRSPDGFHIHGFSLSNSGQQHSNAQALGSTVSLDGLIVSVGSVVQNDHRESASFDSLCTMPAIARTNLRRMLDPITFLHYMATDKPRTFYRLSSPRSPPA